MDVAQPFDVGEYLVGPGPRDRTTRLEGVADQNHAGLAMSGTDIEVGGPDPDLAGNLEIAGDAAKPRQRGL